MANTIITVFNGQGNTKIPFSNYEDGSFIFVNTKSETLREAYSYIQSNYSLSIPLNLTEPTRMFKSRVDIAKHSAERVQNITILLTDINSKYKLDEVLDFFKHKNYACIIGNSNTYDGINDFSVQVLLKVNFLIQEDTIKNALMILQSDLGELCKVDFYSSNITSVQPPSNNKNILLCNEEGKILKNEEVSPVLSNFNSKMFFNDEFIDICLEQFMYLGFHTSTAKAKGNAIPFYRKFETGTKKGYFWFLDNPLVMNHKDKNYAVSIYHFIKNTKIGKEYLKNKTKEEQAKQLIKKDNIKLYKKYLNCNERYLDFSKLNKVKVLDDFLKSDRGVFRLKSPMGTAKSDGVELIIQKAHERKEKVIIVSNRISVAKDFSEKYGLLLYQDPESINSTDSIVVQYDSLHKYDLSNYDIAIFDEYISLLLHHRSNLNTNSNINAVKFKILSTKKRVVIADAFLTGYDITFFEDRDIFCINNEYKDDIELYDYKHRENFIYSLIEKAKNIKEGEHISASFTSLNIIKLVEYELRKEGIRVVSLTSETAELTKELIYKKFQEKTHNSFQVILFTPTLTVGVSNLNNVTSHWHYDSSMGADVISSLQMIKRSRTSKEIHYFVQDRQNHFDTDLDSLNVNAQRNISKYYNNKDKTLLVDIDYETGNLVLTDLAKYINKIEVFYNILANNHANAFRLLLDYQFLKNPTFIKEERESFNLKEKVKGIKSRVREEHLKILEEFSEVSFTEEELMYLNHKISHLEPEEQAKLMLGNVQNKFSKKIPKKKLLELTKLELEDNNFIKYIKNTKLVTNSNASEYSKYTLSTAISTDISTLQDKKHIKFLENLLKFDNNILDTAYTKNDIRKMNAEIFDGKRKFLNFIQDMGYTYNIQSKKYEADIRVFSYLDYL
jgi:hypothetical protein